MKKIFPPTIICCLLLVAQSCSKEAMDDFHNRGAASTTSVRTINATVAPGETYSYSTGGLENITIQKQASHYEFSKVEMDDKNSSLEYQYKPTVGYVGPDEVSLRLESAVSDYGNNGGCGDHSNKSSSVIIKLAITK